MLAIMLDAPGAIGRSSGFPRWVSGIALNSVLSTQAAKHYKAAIKETRAFFILFGLQYSITIIESLDVSNSSLT